MSIERRRRRAKVAVAAYVLAAVALPCLHLGLHRAGHSHGAGANEHVAAHDAGHADTVAAAHRSFDADLESLGLGDAGHFGVANVDCEYARYTMVECHAAAPSVSSSSASSSSSSEGAGAPDLHTFGDELLARAAHETAPAPAFDPRHGAGSLEHLALAYVGAAAFVLPPPPRPVERTSPPSLIDRAGILAAVQHPARGPPAHRSQHIG